MYNKPRLFLVGVLALCTSGIHFAIRSSVASLIQAEYFDPIDKLRSAEMIGAVLGVAFLGFAFTVAIGSLLLDVIGMGRLMVLSSLCFIAGTLVVLNAGPANYNTVWLGMVIVGVGWGLIETVINPLTTTLYPEDTTARLNILHAWWPGGIILGGLLSLLLGHFGVSWQGRVYMTLIPAAAFGLLSLTTKFPPTERAQSGEPVSTMFQAIAKPMFLVWFGSMFLTAASELAPGQWVDMALTRTVGMQGIWLLIYVSGLMFVMRHFAGPLAHKLSPVGLLWCSCVLAAIGLFGLSVANSPVTGLAAATAWGTGVCYLWPTMLAAAAERFPRGGTLLMGLMATAGTLSSFFVLPLLGRIFDEKKVELAGGIERFNQMTEAAREPFLAAASQLSFRYVAVLPVILLFVFGAIWLSERRSSR